MVIELPGVPSQVLTTEVSSICTALGPTIVVVVVDEVDVVGDMVVVVVDEVDVTGGMVVVVVDEVDVTGGMVVVVVDEVDVTGGMVVVVVIVVPGNPDAGAKAARA
jgi:hypothetical protein